MKCINLLEMENISGGYDWNAFATGLLFGMAGVTCLSGNVLGCIAVGAQLSKM